ncbi:chaperone protein DNAj, putative [Trypanosoma brucei gambiense DAL972]|uniref:Chaperone protein DNAj, putative n=1 Tax=Trypanosoma brucei gambiense (strain MHOM/CI/86/DAL972) TaxID=679716 RepID=C9ZRU6_TRYB9|nr:chaperone protein DNAj, putative [Trypanosoma brucei gambiense DAL972]CBH12082.1 chaperone protein DNAj, putative [Trypanosoma brucei gambiense DAL972]|eukprot:XP_011774365.1 chaperone protein DNAj, putative [Trypanosoma brucei gambiense DAL972]
MRRHVSLVWLNAATGWRLHTATTSEGISEETREQLLEEEEFRAMDASQEDSEMLPIHHRLATKADALEAELKRLSFVLFEKPQLVVDDCPSTWTRRPANVVKIIRCYGATNACAKGRHQRPVGWVPPVGSSSTIVQTFNRMRHALLNMRKRKLGQPETALNDQLATLSADLDYLNRMKRLHALNFYGRMNLTPRRHIWLALYTLLWNAVIAIQNSLACVFFGTLRGIRDHGVVMGAIRGPATGFLRASQFLAYGLVLSPLIHVPSGLINSMYGVWNALSGKLFFEAGSGRWHYCSALTALWLHREVSLERRAIRSVGRLEFRRKNMRAENRWKDRLASMGFSFDRINEKFGGNHQKAQHTARGRAENIENPYEVLQVKRNATLEQVKAQYKRLAKVFHPDTVQCGSEEERRKAREKFESISQAYQILSNPEKRRSYDLGGAQALRLHESKMGRFMARTPEEVVQSVFGGEIFKQKVLGQLLRSHWHLRNEAQVSVSLHEFEQLQVLRYFELTLELVRIVDVHAMAPVSKGCKHRSGQPQSEVADALIDELSGRKKNQPARERKQTKAQHKNQGDTPNNEGTGSPYELTCFTNEFNCFSRDFEDRCDRYTRHLAEACFGRELMYEVGQSYVISSQRFLGILPFYAPKLHVYKKIFSGVDRVYAAFREKVDDRAKDNPEWLARKVMTEYFSMEFDSVVADASCVLRFAAQNVLQDVAITEEQRRRRCYALWYLGDQMMRKGVPWSRTEVKRDDGELMAYIQQAANSAASTSKPGSF